MSYNLLCDIKSSRKEGEKMKFNLKNRPKMMKRSILPHGEPEIQDNALEQWFVRFEKELREILEECKEWERFPHVQSIIKEILGE